MPRERRPIAGKVVLVTGGARGIGYATAAALVAHGARVAIGDLDVDATERAAKELGPDVLGVRLDVTDPATFAAVLDDVERRLGPLDVLINNAGIMPLANLVDESEETTARQLAINLEAVIRGTREGIRRMRVRGSGHIVNIASVAGQAGFAGAATYSATKHGVVGLSESVYYELRGSGIEISCVMPTIVRTELAAGLTKTWLSNQVGPEDVATAIVRVLERPRLEVFVPAYLGPLLRVTRLLPHAVGEKVLVWSRSDQLLASAAHSPVRAEYERRALAQPHADL